jgi:two-component system response regulator NreC
MDLSMPNGVDGFAATMNIRRQLPACKIILLTMHDEEIYVQKAIQTGAHGYILKKSQSGELNEAILTVLRGERFYRTGIPQEQLQKMFDKKWKKSSILTMREQEIVRLTILGFTNAQIAEKLFISPKTVENHKANIMQKLELKSKHELIRYGIQNHYLDLTM